MSKINKNRLLRSSQSNRMNKQISEFLNNVPKSYQDGISALAWMRAQAKALDLSISDNEFVAQCARVIASYIKK
jgi:hypothetical protein